MAWLWLIALGCTRSGPAPTVAAVAVDATQTEEEPEAGWYNGACYAALDGDTDTALRFLSASIERGEAPLVWMGEDPDLASVRADSRYLTARDAAIDAWLKASPPTSSADWIAVAHARSLQGRDATHAVERAEALGYRHAVFDEELDVDTPGVQDARRRRAAFVENRRGSITIEVPDVFELANIVLSLTAYGAEPNATDRSTSYATAVEAWFGPHRSHPLITTLDAIPVDIGIYYAFRNQSAAWALEDGALVPNGIYPVGGLWKPDPFTEHREAIEDFIEASDAVGFLAAHREELDGRIASYEDAVPIRAMWDWLEGRFPAEGDGRDALVVRSSPLIGGSHNASTLRLEHEGARFTEGAMVVPILYEGEGIEPVQVGPLARMVFTEIDHHYVNPVSDRMRPAIEAAIPDFTSFNKQTPGSGYDSAHLTFNEYATWVLFDVWWAQWCDENACTPEVRAAGENNTLRVMERRKFHRYEAFRNAMVKELVGATDLEATFPQMLAWFEANP